ncbi:hypothetical protein LV84_00801 [Algoriphagus ratkowskyi]|uniref:Uncharacterized protein n=1 Tax=Algoriphagus ratkowskyi TaxID=57028 RepID=A0A2W7RFB5_9BACT|nr:hypothetical protein [Algoriphagus ratkowskyi]PZX59593.1 hypothetical protein LV84_00801 [Algoriphagus ratkowskyi]TXD78683.1 hypothetical protein ESW18_07795 [Algoriphagus ratkowskyi]
MRESLSLSLLIFLLGITSCQEIPDGIQALDDQVEELYVSKVPEYESKLKHLTHWASISRSKCKS